ncbi:MAG: transcription factor S [Candidatus Heimdallarchaeota archaeon]
MSMEFCDDCGSMLTPKKIDSKVVMMCPKCGEGKKELGKGELLTEEIKHSKEEKIVVIENPDLIRTNPTKPMRCSKCKKVTETEYWAVQTRSGDEAATRFFRCTKCKAVWREYD